MKHRFNPVQAFSPRSTERGNILFLILLAVILFAALSYAVTNSLRGGGNDASSEKVEAQAASLLNYFAEMDTAIQRMMLTGKVRDYELNFCNASGTQYIAGCGDNTNCTADRCRVFTPDGGNVKGRILRVAPYTNGMVSPDRIYMAHIPGIGSDKLDILFSLHDPNPALCKAINNRAGLPDLIYDAPMTGNWNNASNKPYLYGINTGPIVDNANYWSVPANIGPLGTFCVCSASLASGTCANGGLNTAIVHVLVTR